MTDPQFQKKQERRGRAVEAIRNALTLEEKSNFYELPAVLARHLSEDELAAVGFCVLKALPHEQAVAVAAHAVGPSELPEQPDQETHMFAARMWADSANEQELKAYAHAAIMKMAPRSKQRLKDWLLSKMGGSKA